MRRALTRLLLAPVLVAVMLADTFDISFCLVVVVVAIAGYVVAAAALGVIVVEVTS